MNSANRLAVAAGIIVSVVFATSRAPADTPWESVAKVNAPLAVDRQDFGHAMVMTEQYVFVSTPGLLAGGAVYVYDRATLERIRTLYGPDSELGDYFGWSLAVDADLLLVGAPSDDDRGDDSGSVYAFDIATGAFLKKFTAPDGEAGDSFGYSVAINDAYIVIGAALASHSIREAGSVYVIDRATGVYLHELRSPEPADEGRFGLAAALEGATALIGATGSRQGADKTGAAYIFDLASGEHLRTLIDPDGKPDDALGYSVDLENGRAAVGAPFDGSGSVHIFDVTTGEALYKSQVDDIAFNARFGFAVDVEGDRTVVGAPYANGNSDDSGLSFVINMNSGDVLATLSAPDGGRNAHLGSSVAMDPHYVWVGAPDDMRNDERAGSAYVFAQPTTNVVVIDPEPLRAGESADFAVIGALPNERTWLVYSLAGLGLRFIRNLNVVIDLEDPQLGFGPRRTDAQGNVSWQFEVPTGLAGFKIWFQAVQPESATIYTDVYVKD